ncbi:zinc finger protein 329-like [Pseudochaenichthys georgianus]|uniref:zinc finger protein 329-like n=1 Tax=Pseudochaenichthys georgianus TaxID=52239 RepID=UPI00146AD9B2|nr:zinc finger protein 239-like isoform X2 [Pseudochaenichthys georgianus]
MTTRKIKLRLAYFVSSYIHIFHTVEMAAVEKLRSVINERLAAAADEIFGVFAQALSAYEEEICRQRRLLDTVLKPQIKLHRTELPQQHVCNEDEVLTDQQLCSQERNSSLDQEDSEPPQIKEEQEELCTSQEEELLELKQETDVFMVTLTDEESVHSGQTCAKGGKPQIKLHRTELPQQHVCNEDEVLTVLTDQQLCSQERNSCLDQEDPEPPQIKEEQEELCTRQEEEQLELKQETDVFMLTLTDEESVHSGQTCAKESVGNMPVLSVVVSEAQSNLQLISHNSNDSGLTRTADPEIDKIHHKTKKNKVNNANLSDMQRNTCTVKNYLKCETCGKDFKYMSILRRHMTTHPDEKPYSCQTCGRDFRESSSLMYHMRLHTDEKKYTCKTCGKKFRFNIDFESHMRIHTGEMPFVCMTCEKRFDEMSKLKRHMKCHTGEKPYVCMTCGKSFIDMSKLKRHMKCHTGEKPYVCMTCGKSFIDMSTLKRHMKVHTGEKPFTCKACGHNFGRKDELLSHMRRIHAAEKA